MSEKKIKVLHTEWSNGWGGQEIRIINEMIALRELGVELFLACKEKSKIKQKAIENGFKVFILPFRGNTDFKTLFGLMKIIKEKRIDIVNTHSGKDTWVGGLAAKISGAKFIRTRHLSNRINNGRLNFINELADFIFTTGESVKDDMIRYNRIKSDKIKSIPTGIDDNLFNPINLDRKKCRDQFALDIEDIVIANLGVLRSFKRQDIFIDIAKELISKYPDKKIKFLIAGEGPQREKLEEQISKLDLQSKVILLGHVSDVPQFLYAIDIFLFTSDSKEGVPQSVMQALLMNRKVIATDVGSTRDLYKNNNFILKEFNKKQLLDATENILNSLDDIILNRDFIKNNFSKNVMRDNIYEVYTRLLS
jgi:glycosyltransferase involved in cell wall biosynthesis